MPKHGHQFNAPTGTSLGSYVNIATTNNYVKQAITDWVKETGGNKAHNNMPPYYAVNIWKRTA